MSVLAGILSPIEDVLTEVLTWLHGAVGLPWAWAIVIVTVAMRIVILPLSVQQIRSVQRLAFYAPEMKAIQDRYKGDRQRQQEEIMKLYKEHKINPAASCLPMLPQIPIFISLFYVLRDFEKEVFPDFPQSSLGFLNDWVPNITDPINERASGWVLLVIYGATQLLSMWLSMTSVQSKFQRYLFMVLPIVFIPVVIRFPVGLLIYWMTTNLWTIGQGIVTRRLYPKPPMDAFKRTSKEPSAKPERVQQPAKQRSGGQKPASRPAKPKQGAADGTAPRPVRRRKKRGGPNTRR